MTEDDRRERWESWESSVWDAVERELGDPGSKGAGRLFDGVWVMMHPIDVGIVNVSVCRSPQRGEQQVLGYAFNARWESDPAEGVSDWVVRLVRRVLEDERFLRR